MFIQKQSKFWWTQNIRYFIYFVRESTGIFIAFYVIYFLVSALLHSTDWNDFLPTKSFRIVSVIGLTAAVFHTITWLAVTVRISPIPLKKIASIAAFFALIAIWFVISLVLINSNFIYASY